MSMTTRTAADMTADEFGGLIRFLGCVLTSVGLVPEEPTHRQVAAALVDVADTLDGLDTIAARARTTAEAITAGGPR
jgi:hypothetical protein